MRLSNKELIGKIKETYPKEVVDGTFKFLYYNDKDEAVYIPYLEIEDDGKLYFIDDNGYIEEISNFYFITIVSE